MTGTQRGVTLADSVSAPTPRKRDGRKSRTDWSPTVTNDSKTGVEWLHLRTTEFEEDTAIDAMHDKSHDNWPYDAELRAAVAAAIRRFPNTEAQWWIGPESVLRAVESFLVERGVEWGGGRDD